MSQSHMLFYAKGGGLILKFRHLRRNLCYTSFLFECVFAFIALILFSFYTAR